MTVIKLSFTVLSELYWIRWQFRIHSYKSATKRQSLTAYTIFIRSDIKPVFWLCALNVCSKDFHKPNTLCKYGSTNKTALPCSTSPCSSVIQPSNGLWDGRAENKTHANAWPGSRVSPPAIEHHSSQVQPTWSLIYQWEALFSQHSDTEPSFPPPDRKLSPLLLCHPSTHTLAPALVRPVPISSGLKSPSDVYWERAEGWEREGQELSKEQKRPERGVKMFFKKKKKRDVKREKERMKEEIEEMHIGSGPWGLWL